MVSASGTDEETPLSGAEPKQSAGRGGVSTQRISLDSVEKGLQKNENWSYTVTHQLRKGHQKGRFLRLEKPASKTQKGRAKVRLQPSMLGPTWHSHSEIMPCDARECVSVRRHVCTCMLRFLSSAPTRL